MDEIRYSKKIPGDEGNYRMPVRFDESGGYIGISQFHEGIERVLLNKKQVRELVKFCSVKGKR